jgi:flagellar biosynthesis protein FliQ
VRKSRWTPEQLGRAGSSVVIALAVVVSIRLFVAIDSASHSASDTLLGFVPNDIVIWAVALLTVWLLRRLSHPTRR